MRKILITLLSIFIAQYCSAVITVTNNNNTIFTGTNYYNGVSIYTATNIIQFSTNFPVNGLAITNVNAQQLNGFTSDYFLNSNTVLSGNGYISTSSLPTLTNGFITLATAAVLTNNMATTNFVISNYIPNSSLPTLTNGFITLATASVLTNGLATTNFVISNFIPNSSLPTLTNGFITLANAAELTNNLATTNFVNSFVSNSMNSYLSTNGGVIGGSVDILGDVYIASNVYVSGSLFVTNIFETNISVTISASNLNVSGSIVSTKGYFLTNGFNLINITNGLATTNYVNSAIANNTNSSLLQGLSTNAFIKTNQIFGITNGFVGESITNGLATINYVDTSIGNNTNASLFQGLSTNAFIKTNQVFGITNGFVGSTITNGLATTDYVDTSVANNTNASLLQGLSTNAFIKTNQVFGITNGFVGSTITNGLATTGYVDTSVANNTNASLLQGLSTNAFIKTNQVFGITNGFVGSNITNGLATTSYVDTAVANNTNASLLQGLSTNAFIKTNQVFGITNGFVGAGITNGLATTNYVNTAVANNTNSSLLQGLTTNAFVLTNQVFGITNGFVGSNITNGLATTGYVNTAVANNTNASLLQGLSTNAFIKTNQVFGITNGFVSASITNGLATTNYVNSSVANFVTTSGVSGLISQSNALITPASIGAVSNTAIGIRAAGGLTNEPHLILQNGAGLEPTGWQNNDGITVKYLTNNCVELTGGLTNWWRGTAYAISSPWTSTPSATSNGTYFLAFRDNGTNPVWSSTMWTFDMSQIAAVTITSNYTACVKETHGMSMDWTTHRSLHTQIGTFVGSGLLVGNYVLNQDSTGQTISVSSGIIRDEDNSTTIDGTSSGGPYTWLLFTGSGNTYFITNQVSIGRKGTGQYGVANTLSGGIWTTNTEIVASRFVNYYLIHIPVASDGVSQNYRTVVLQPQVATYTTLAAAQAEDFRSLNFGDMGTLQAEFVPYARLTYDTANSYVASPLKQRLRGVGYITGSKATAVNVSGVFAGGVTVVQNDSADAGVASLISGTLTIGTNTSTFVTSTITNGLATTNYVNTAVANNTNASLLQGLSTNAFIKTNEVFGITNGFVSASITNGLATTNYVNTTVANNTNASLLQGLSTNAFIKTNQVFGITNGFVSASITNGLAGTNYVNTAVANNTNASLLQGLSTNAFIKTNEVFGITNGFVSASITNSLLTTNATGTGLTGVWHTGDVITNAVMNNAITNNNTSSVTISNNLLSSGTITATNLIKGSVNVIAYGDPVFNTENFLGDYTLQMVDLWNFLHRSESRFSVYSSGFSTFTTNKLFDGDYENAGDNIISLSSTGIVSIVFTNKTEFDSNGITYPQGTVYIHSYKSTPPYTVPAGVSGRYKDRNGVWYNLTNPRLFGNTWKLTLPYSAPYMCELELTIAGSIADGSRITEIDYFRTRPGTDKWSIPSKYNGEHIYSAWDWKNGSATTMARISPSGASYITAGNFGVMTNNPQAPLHVHGNAIISGTLNVGGSSLGVGITNGLAGTNYVNTAVANNTNASLLQGLSTNAFIKTNQVFSITNGFVSAGITNGLATTNYVDSAVGTRIGTSSWSVIYGLTNGLANTNYVNNADTNLQGQITLATNRIFTLEGRTNYWNASLTNGNLYASTNNFIILSNRVVTLEGQTNSYLLTNGYSGFTSAGIMGLGTNSIIVSGAGKAEVNGKYYFKVFSVPTYTNPANLFVIYKSAITSVWNIDTNSPSPVTYYTNNGAYVTNTYLVISNSPAPTISYDNGTYQTLNDLVVKVTSLTNGLATTNYVNNADTNLQGQITLVTNRIFTLEGRTNYWNAAITNSAITNGFVGAGITNGLATTNYVDSAVGTRIGTSSWSTIYGLTNGFIKTNNVTSIIYSNPSAFQLAGTYLTPTATNGLASTNYVNTKTTGMLTNNHASAVTFISDLDVKGGLTSLKGITGSGLMNERYSGLANTMAAFQIDGSVQYGMAFSCMGDNSYGVWQEYFKSRSLNGTTHAIVVNGDELARFNFFADNGSTMNEIAGFTCSIDGVPSAGSLPSRFDFYTSPVGTVTKTERLSISPNGNVGINVHNATEKLDVEGSVRISSNLNVIGTISSSYVDPCTVSLSLYPYVVNGTGTLTRSMGNSVYITPTNTLYITVDNTYPTNCDATIIVNIFYNDKPFEFLPPLSSDTKALLISNQWNSAVFHKGFGQTTFNGL